MERFFVGLLYTVLVVTSIFLICLVLIQRGKGGGLAGAFGGVGGSSAFGTKAGDVFTRVTIGVAAVWFILSMLLVVLSNREQRASAFDPGGSPGTQSSADGFPTGKSPKSSPSRPDTGDLPIPSPEDLPPPGSGGAGSKAPASSAPDLPSPLDDPPPASGKPAPSTPPDSSKPKS